VQVLADRTTLAQAHSGPFRWTCLAAAQVLLDAVEMSDLAGSHPQRYGACSRASWKLRRTCAQHPARVIWRAWVLTKLPWPRRRRALQGALEVRRDHILEAVRSATGFPVIGHIPPGDNAVQSGQVWFGPSPETDNESESKDVGWLKCSAAMPTITAFQPTRERSTPSAASLSRACIAACGGAAKSAASTGGS
jgi:hypothetical protein